MSSSNTAMKALRASRPTGPTCCLAARKIDRVGLPLVNNMISQDLAADEDPGRQRLDQANDIDHAAGRSPCPDSALSGMEFRLEN